MRPIAFAPAVVALAAVLLTARAVGAKDDLPPRVDEAIRKGSDFLVQAPDWGMAKELVLLALIHAGCDRDATPLREGTTHLLTSPLQSTYQVSLAAVALVNLDRIRHQARIADCAQFLVDSQCANGQWSYGGVAPSAPFLRTGQEGRAAPIRLRRRTGTAAPGGDNSNTQFALYGLWAAQLAMVESPEATWRLAHDFFVRTQGRDGGWGYSADDTQSSYGSMTCAGMGGLAICARAIKATKGTAEKIERGVSWLGGKFTVKGNPGFAYHSGTHHLYYLYSLERAAALLERDRFGGHDWYDEGARELLGIQLPDGSWNSQVIDTCFAILFLERATRTIATESARRPTAVTTPDDELEGK